MRAGSAGRSPHYGEPVSDVVRSSPGVAAVARRPRLTLRTQVLLLVTALVAGVLLVSTAVAVWVLRGNLERQFEQRALAIARTVAVDERFATWVTSTPPSAAGPAQAEAEHVRRTTGALYVVVTDDAGIRWSHPNPSLVGKVVSTDPSQALAGDEVTALDRGTLGESARGKTPLRDASGRVVGEVSVGMALSDVDAAMWGLTRLLLLVGLAALLLGVAGAVVLARRVRRSTHGLEPGEMADLLREHEAILGGVRDGVVAVDRRGVVTAANEEAARLLGRPPRIGVPVEAAGLPRSVRTLLEREDPPVGELVAVRNDTLLATRLPVRREGRDLGLVLVLRDHSDLDELARELEATRALTDALRAQAHEYTNRLHALTGMLHLGHVEEARGYLDELRAATSYGELVADPYLAGLLAAKAAAASEAGVELRVGETSWVDGRLTQPLDCVTVVANLIDNGVRAAAEAPERDAEPGRTCGRWVEITLASDGDALVVHVVDSGPGLASGAEGDLFRPGWTTRDLPAGDVERHGLGLALAHRTARRHAGDVVLAVPGAPGHGAAFTARLEGVVAPAAAVVPS